MMKILHQKIRLTSISEDIRRRMLESKQQLVWDENKNKQLWTGPVGIMNEFNSYWS